MTFQLSRISFPCPSCPEIRVRQRLTAEAAAVNISALSLSAAPGPAKAKRLLDCLMFPEILPFASGIGKEHSAADAPFCRMLRGGRGVLQKLSAFEEKHTSNFRLLSKIFIYHVITVY